MWHLELTLKLGRRVLLLILAGGCPVGSLLELLHEGGRWRRPLALGVVLAARLGHVVELLWVGWSSGLPGEAWRGDHSATENVVVLLMLRRLLLLVAVGATCRLLGLEGLLFAHLVAVHRDLLLLTDGLSSEGHALAGHLALLLLSLGSVRTSLHLHKPLHLRVHEATPAMARRQRPLAHLLLLQLRWLLLVLLLRRVDWLLAVLACERGLGHLQTLIEMVTMLSTQLVLLLLLLVDVEVVWQVV